MKDLLEKTLRADAEYWIADAADYLGRVDAILLLSRRMRDHYEAEFVPDCTIHRLILAGLQDCEFTGWKTAAEHFLNRADDDRWG